MIKEQYCCLNSNTTIEEPVFEISAKIDAGVAGAIDLIGVVEGEANLMSIDLLEIKYNSKEGFSISSIVTEPAQVSQSLGIGAVGMGIEGNHEFEDGGTVKNNSYGGSLKGDYTTD